MYLQSDTNAAEDELTWSEVTPSRYLIDSTINIYIPRYAILSNAVNAILDSAQISTGNRFFHKRCRIEAEV